MPVGPIVGGVRNLHNSVPSRPNPRFTDRWRYSRPSHPRTSHVLVNPPIQGSCCAGRSTYGESRIPTPHGKRCGHARFVATSYHTLCSGRPLCSYLSSSNTSYLPLSSRVRCSNSYNCIQWLPRDSECQAVNWRGDTGFFGSWVYGCNVMTMMPF